MSESFSVPVVSSPSESSLNSRKSGRKKRGSRSSKSGRGSKSSKSGRKSKSKKSGHKSSSSISSSSKKNGSKRASKSFAFKEPGDSILPLSGTITGTVVINPNAQQSSNPILDMRLEDEESPSTSPSPSPSSPIASVSASPPVLSSSKSQSPATDKSTKKKTSSSPSKNPLSDPNSLNSVYITGLMSKNSKLLTHSELVQIFIYAASTGKLDDLETDYADRIDELSEPELAKIISIAAKVEGLTRKDLILMIEDQQDDDDYDDTNNNNNGNHSSSNSPNKEKRGKYGSRRLDPSAVDSFVNNVFRRKSTVTSRSSLSATIAGGNSSSDFDSLKPYSTGDTLQEALDSGDYTSDRLAQVVARAEEAANRTPQNVRKTAQQVRQKKWGHDRGSDEEKRMDPKLFFQLRMACSEGNIEQVRTIVEGLDRPMTEGELADLVLGSIKHYDLLIYLKNHTAADLTCITDDGVSALHEAATLGAVQTVRFMMESCGGNIDLRDQNGRTVIERIAEKRAALGGGSVEVLQLLVEGFGADVHSPNKSGRSLIYYAASPPVAKWLIESCSVDLEQVDFRGNTPLGHHMLRGHLSVINLLESYGAPAYDSASLRRSSFANFFYFLILRFQYVALLFIVPGVFSESYSAYSLPFSLLLLDPFSAGFVPYALQFYVTVSLIFFTGLLFLLGSKVTNSLRDLGSPLSVLWNGVGRLVLGLYFITAVRTLLLEFQLDDIPIVEGTLSLSSLVIITYLGIRFTRTHDLLSRLEYSSPITDWTDDETNVIPADAHLFRPSIFAHNNGPKIQICRFFLVLTSLIFTRSSVIIWVAIFIAFTMIIFILSVQSANFYDESVASLDVAFIASSLVFGLFSLVSITVSPFSFVFGMIIWAIALVSLFYGFRWYFLSERDDTSFLSADYSDSYSLLTSPIARSGSRTSDSTGGSPSPVLKHKSASKSK